MLDAAGIITRFFDGETIYMSTTQTVVVLAKISSLTVLLKAKEVFEFLTEELKAAGSFFIFNTARSIVSLMSCH